ncbi:MAG TPA: amidase [Acidimicrobiales bacterium]|nr:amidase [Acidimicrobiales bacterium]
MATFITRLDASGDGPRLAVKDLIDVEGVPTTAGSRAVARSAQPAAADAPCVVSARRAGARIVGKVNLHELAFGGTGINPWYGTPTNPLDPERIPGGSSSGSAVAVAEDEADVAYGSDTGGSVRIPSACCGTVGLKTTFGRISCDGVWPLAQSLDTVGPMAADVAGVVLGMQLLEPGFAPGSVPHVVGRLRGVPAHEAEIAQAVDAALGAAGFEVVDVELPGWNDAFGECISLMCAEGYANNRRLLEEQPDDLGDDVSSFFMSMGSAVDSAQLQQLRSDAAAWRKAMADVLGRVEVIACPTLMITPPRLDDAGGHAMVANFTAPVNFAGNPALALPVPRPGGLPASLQLIGPHGGEEALVAAGAAVEAAVG